MKRVWFTCEFGTHKLKRINDDNTSGLDGAGRIFASRIARKEYGEAGTVRTFREDARARDGSFCEFRAFIGRPGTGIDRGATVGRDIHFTVHAVEEKIAIFKSKPVDGRIYVAERTRKRSSRLRWSAMPEHTGADVAVPWKTVPLAVRREARTFFRPEKRA